MESSTAGQSTRGHLAATFSTPPVEGIKTPDVVDDEAAHYDEVNAAFCGSHAIKSSGVLPKVSRRATHPDSWYETRPRWSSSAGSAGSEESESLEDFPLLYSSMPLEDSTGIPITSNEDTNRPPRKSTLKSPIAMPQPTGMSAQALKRIVKTAEDHCSFPTRFMRTESLIGKRDRQIDCELSTACDRLQDMVSAQQCIKTQSFYFNSPSPETVIEEDSSHSSEMGGTRCNEGESPYNGMHTRDPTEDGIREEDYH